MCKRCENIYVLSDKKIGNNEIIKDLSGNEYKVSGIDDKGKPRLKQIKR